MAPPLDKPPANGGLTLAAAFIARAEQRCSQGELQKAEADYAKAAEVLGKAVAEGSFSGDGAVLPSLPKVLTLLGVLLLIRGDTAGAERALVAAVDQAAAKNSPWPARWAEPPSRWPAATVDVARFYLLALYRRERETPGGGMKYVMRGTQWDSRQHQQLALRTQRAAAGDQAAADVDFFTMRLAAATAMRPCYPSSFVSLFESLNRLEVPIGHAGTGALSLARAHLISLRYLSFFLDERIDGRR